MPRTFVVKFRDRPGQFLWIYCRDHGFRLHLTSNRFSGAGRGVRPDATPFIRQVSIHRPRVRPGHGSPEAEVRIVDVAGVGSRIAQVPSAPERPCDVEDGLARLPAGRRGTPRRRRQRPRPATGGRSPRPPIAPRAPDAGGSGCGPARRTGSRVRRPGTGGEHPPCLPVRLTPLRPSERWCAVLPSPARAARR
jgi:hypothetical protein